MFPTGCGYLLPEVPQRSRRFSFLGRFSAAEAPERHLVFFLFGVSLRVSSGHPSSRVLFVANMFSMGYSL